jgi:hypothetical protein
VSSSSAVKYVTITNSGPALLIFSKLSISGNFQNADKGTCKSVVAAGAKCTYSAKFVPKASGIKSGVMSITIVGYCLPLKKLSACFQTLEILSISPQMS